MADAAVRSGAGQSGAGGVPPGGGGGLGGPGKAPYKIDFDREFATSILSAFWLAAQEFARDWRKDFRLQGRRPGGVEVRLHLTSGDVIKVHFAGLKIIDDLLAGVGLRGAPPPGAPSGTEGRSTALYAALRRSGVPVEVLTEAAKGGALAGVQLAVGALYPVSSIEYAAGVRVRAKPPDDFRYRNKDHVNDFLRESRWAAAQRRADLGPREAMEAARRLAAETGEPVALGVPGEIVTVRPQEAATAEVIHRVKQDADVGVLRGKDSGQFVSAFDPSFRDRIYQRAQAEGFSAVARIYGVARTTIYGWAPKGGQ